MTDRFVPLGAAEPIPIRCVVCGKEYDVSRSIAERAARSVSDGSHVPTEPDDQRGVFPDGRIAGACIAHTDDEVRTAWVLTEWKLAVQEGT